MSFDLRARGASTSEEFKRGYGYALYDLNGDGADELVLMRSDYALPAIYATYRGMPLMLESFHLTEVRNILKTIRV